MSRSSRNRGRLAAAAALTTALTATACGGGTTTDGGSNDDPKTLTYWASNQGPSVEADKKILTPELEKFEKKTGIKVKLEVIPWDSLLDRILAATSSGQGPDVLNIGNTWSSSLQSSGGLLPWTKENFEKIGGRDRFEPSAVAAAGAKGEPPSAVPLYSLSYALYYNKEMFEKAGIDGPPKTWKEFDATAKKLTSDGRYGVAVEGGNPVENAHHAFIFAKQHGADFFDDEGNPTFDKPGNVKGVKQYIDLLANDKVAAPGNAEYAQNQTIKDVATGKAAMMLWQAAGSTLKPLGMKEDEYGVAPIPVQEGQQDAVNSMVAGINIAVFENTDNHDGAIEFVKFMTSDDEQRILNETYGSIPPVKPAQQDAAFAEPEQKVLREVLSNTSDPLPQVPDESQFETLVGTAMKELFADAAAGRTVTEDAVKQRLTKAQQQMQK